MAVLNKREDVPCVVMVSRSGVAHLEVMTEGEITAMELSASRKINGVKSNTNNSPNRLQGLKQAELSKS